MSVEVFVGNSSDSNFYEAESPIDHNIATLPESPSSVENVEESPEVTKQKEQVAQRGRFHDDIVTNVRRLDELQRRHYTLQLGLISLSQTADRETREAMVPEYNELTEKIIELRQAQGELITDTADCNRSIWRPPADGNNWEKAERNRIERPLLVEIYNDGEDPDDITPSYSPENEFTGNGHHYIKNAVI